MSKRKRKPITRAGRPIKEIDWTIVDHKLRANCHGTTIASIFDMHPQTFYNKVIEEKKMSFTEYSAQKKLEGDDCIKTAQYEEAVIEKNTTLLVWLGKVRLEQKEHPEVVSTPNDAKLDVLLADVKSMKDKFVDKPSLVAELPKSDECP